MRETLPQALGEDLHLHDCTYIFMPRSIGVFVAMPRSLSSQVAGLHSAESAPVRRDSAVCYVLVSLQTVESGNC